MTSINPARRRAERFDAAIEASSTATTDARLLELVELVGALREAPQPVARPAHVADLRARLMAAAETELVPAARTRTSAPRAPRARRDRRIAVALGGLAIVGATTSMAVAAQSALPGDALYPLKRAIEDVDTTVTAGDDDKGAELLGHATNRLDEVEELSQGSIDSSRTQSIETTLTAFSDQATEASDLLLGAYADTGSEQAITTLRTFTRESLLGLSRLEGDLPTDLRPAVVSAAQVLISIDQQASEACPECDGLGITDIPTGLMSADADLGAALGPVVPPLTEPVTAAVDGATKNGKPTKTRPSTTTSAPTSTDTGGQGDTAPLPQAGTKPLPTPLPTAKPSGGTLGSAVDGIVKGVTGQPPASGTPANPTAGPTSLGEAVDGAVGSVTDLASTLLDPLTGLPKQP